MKKLLLALMALGLGFFTACSQPADEPAETDAEAMMEDSADAVEDVADEAADAVEKAADEVEDAM